MTWLNYRILIHLRAQGESKEDLGRKGPSSHKMVQPPDFLYFLRYWSCMRLIAPLRLVRMRLTADTASRPDSMRAIVTRIGARPKPATQWMPMAGLSVPPEEFLNTFLQMLNQLSTTALGGASPSGKGMSCFLGWQKQLRIPRRKKNFRNEIGRQGRKEEKKRRFEKRRHNEKSQRKVKLAS